MRVRNRLTWWSTTVWEPAQKPPEEQRPIATEPTSMSTFSAYDQYISWTSRRAKQITYWDIVQLRQSTAGPSNSTNREALIQY